MDGYEVRGLPGVCTMPGWKDRGRLSSSKRYTYPIDASPAPRHAGETSLIALTYVLVHASSVWYTSARRSRSQLRQELLVQLRDFLLRGRARGPADDQPLRVALGRLGDDMEVDVIDDLECCRPPQVYKLGSSSESGREGAVRT